MPGPFAHHDSVYEFPGRHVQADASAYSRARNRARARVFFAVLVTALLISLSYTFLRPAIYQSTAMLLVTPPLLDERAGEISNSQHAELERRTLLGHRILEQTRERLVAGGGGSGHGWLTLEELDDVLDAKLQERTNLIELTATGEDRELLPELLDAWIQVYVAAHDEVLASASSDENRDIDRQLAEIREKVESKRKALEEYRGTYDIVSMERSENRVLKRLNGLTDALNNAQEEQIAARSRVEAIETALAQGKPVGTDRSETALASLEDRLVSVKEQIKDLEREFTPQYMSMDPQMTALSRKKEFLENEIRRKRREGGEIALAEAQQDLLSAGQSVVAIQRQLDEEKLKVMTFTTRFAEHESLKEELALLEEQYRQVQQRQLAMQVDTGRQFSRVEVKALPYLPERPVYPHYGRDAAISCGLSVLLALLAVWFYDYMTRPARQAGAPGPVFVSAASPVPLAREEDVRLPRSSPQLLEQVLPRELSEREVLSLLDVTDAGTRLLLTCLLGGLGLSRLTGLRWGEEGLSADDPGIETVDGRGLPVSASLQSAIDACRSAEAVAGDPVWKGADAQPLSAEDMEALITCAAHDAGLSRPEEVGSATMTHTYLAWLARMGVRLADLGRLADGVPPRLVAAYGALSPPGEGKPLQDVDAVYPALIAFFDGHRA